MHLFSSLVIAFSTYSRIPMPAVSWTDENRRLTFCFFPLIGLVTGFIMAVWLFLCEKLSVGPLLKGCVAASLPLLVTGGIHMDGFMDTCDALASWQPPEKRLEILKDSHVGAFAVIGCAVYLLLMTGLLSECTLEDVLPVCICFVLSRALSAYLSVTRKQARQNGMLSGFAGSAASGTVRRSSILYVLLCTCCLFYALGMRAVFHLLFTALTVVYYCRMTDRYFGGVTGDLAGWFLQISEITGIACIVLGGKII